MYAVGIGAASGVVANILGWIGDILARREAKRRARAARVSDELFPVFAKHLLESAEGVLGEHSPADFDTTPNAAAECIDTVRSVEDKEWWRAGYDSLDSFYEAHEARHPDIRVYAAVRREIRMADAMDPPAGIGGLITGRIARRRVQPES